MGQMESVEGFMERTLALAAAALERGELPIAALVVLDGQIIAQAITLEKEARRYLIHAELLALEEADKLELATAARRRAKLFTNLEPCLMCMGAAMSFFLGEIYYGLESPADGAVELVRGWRRRQEHLPAYRLPRIRGGLLRDESIKLFEQYVRGAEEGPLKSWARSLTEPGKTMP